jgi:2'-5' RNA ligase
MRLFFALWPDAALRERIADVAAALRLAATARRVSRQNYHVTLVFIGEVASSELAALRQLATRHRIAASEIRFDAYEYWEGAQAVVAVAQRTPDALSELANGLGRSNHVEPALRLHVTLARKVAQAPVLQAMSPIDWNASSFSLMRSDTSHAHSVYTVVDTWPLLDKRQKSSHSL